MVTAVAEPKVDTASVEIVSHIENTEVYELAVYPAKAKRDCYAFYTADSGTGGSGDQLIFWMHHGPTEDTDIDLGKSYKTLLPALKAALKDAEKHSGRGNPKLVTALKRAITRAQAK